MNHSIWRKTLSLLLALVMVMGMVCTTALAEEETTPEDNTTACETCGKDPCECEESKACETCGKDPCECEPESKTCEDCGKDPCVCEELALEAFMDALEKLQELQDQNDPDADEFMEASDKVLELYDALTAEQKDGLGEDLAEAMETLRDGVNPTVEDAPVSMTGAEFLAKADEGGNIALDGDVTLTDNCVWVQDAQSPLILDLNGHTIYGRVACYGGDLTIRGSGAIDTTALGWSPLLNNGEGGETHLTVEGGTFITSNGVNSLYNMNGAVADIKGGSFPNGIGNGWWDGDANGAAQEGGGVVNISGGVIGAQEFDASDTTFFIPAVSNAAEVNISGGTIVQSSNSASTVDNYGTMNITGGSVKAKQANFGVIGNYYSGTITISDGTFVGAIENWFTTGEQPIQISGGTFSFPTTYAEKMQSYLVEDVKLNEDGQVVSTIVAKIGDKGYTTLQAAIEAATGENDIVTLYGAVNENVTIGKPLTLSGGTINGTVTVEADVKLTIDDVTIAATAGPGIAVTGMGVELEVKGENSVTSTAQNYAGIEVPMETSLTITGDGNLTAKGNGGAGVGGSCNGGVAKWLNGNITVDMTGTLEAVGTGSQTNGNYGGAGIGAASYHNPADIKEQMPGTITIKNGTIIATGGNSCAGIGGGSHTPTGAITIEDGNITAVSAGGAGIGSGSTGKGTATVAISGGTINATGGWLAAGIGGSYKAGAEVTITGGDITATGGNGNEGTTYQGGPGIGGGYHGNGEVSISNATIKATGGNSAPGIGTGAVSDRSKVTITSGNITAQGGCNAPGIGGGNAIKNVDVSISGGTVDAKGGDGMPGIGSGVKVDAHKDKYAAETTATVTIGSGAKLADGTTVGAPEGNKYYECTEQSDGTKVYKTTEHPADTVALLISGETVTPKSSLATAITDAKEGDTVQLVTSVTLNAALNVNKAITLDLNGKTLTLAIMDDGLVGYSGCTIQNGNIVYTGTKNAIKAENIALIDGVDVKAENADVGVMIWGNGRHLDVISNSTITGAKRGISTYKVNPDGNTVSAIGEMNKVTVDAKEYGVVINLSHCGKIVDSDITGGNRGISFQWHNDHAAYPPAKCEITGGSVTAKNGPAIEFWDNRGVTGEGYTVATKINGTRLSGTEANTGALIYSLAKGDVKFEATVDGTNAVCGCENAPWSNEWSESRWFDSFASAIANVNWSSKPLELLANVNETVTINKRVAVNLNGHTLNGLTLGEGGTVVADGSVGIVAPEGFVVVESVSDGTYTYTLRAVVPVTGVTLSQTNASMYTGNTVNLTATVTPDDADDKTVTWSSSNTSVATVDANGVVTAVGTGTANITATVGTVSATCEVTVSTYTGGGTVYYPSTPTPTPPVVDITDPDVPLAELPLPFEDVKDGDWYREAVAYVYSNGLMVGTSDTLFGVNTNTSRGMMATVIYRLDKEPNTTFEKIFSDVDNGMWYSNPITWANANKVAVGYDDGSFGPNDNVTREQLVAMLYRYAGNKGYDVSKRADLSVFADAGKVSGYAEEAMSWAVAAGLIQGRGASKLAPTDLALRVEVAAIFQRFAALYEAETLA